jgi:hypothetical protein
VRLILAGLVAGAAIGVGAAVMFARGDTVHTAAPAEEAGLAVQAARLEPGLMVLSARNDGEEAVHIAQVLVNDAFVDFHAARKTVAAHAETQVSVHYPWIAGQSYEIGLLTASGAIVEYELEDAGET